MLDTLLYLRNVDGILELKSAFDENYVMKHKKGVVIVDLNIQYLREARLGDVFEVRLSSELEPNNSVLYHHELVHKERNKLYCKETVTGVIMDLQTRRKIDVPEDFKKALDDFKKPKCKTLI